MIYARIDVAIVDHPKLLLAGAVARDLWVWGNLHARHHRTDGELDRIAVLTAAWGLGQRRNARVASKLVTCGLWATTEQGWRIINYEAKNDTRDVIEKNLTAQKERQNRFRDAKRNALHPANSNALLTPKREREREREREIKEPPNPQGGSVGLDLVSDAKPNLTLTDATPRQQDYQAAYERGVALGKGGGYHMPSNQRGELHGAIAAHGRGSKSGTAFRGEKLLAWLEASAADFAEEVKDNNPQFYSSFGPRGWLKWLNERTQTREAKAVP